MATRVGVTTPVKGFGEEAHTVQWAGLLSNDEGDLLHVPGHSLKSIQFSGPFGDAGKVVLEGSNDGKNFVVLTDPQGNPIIKTKPSLENIEELVYYIRPKVLGGDAITNIVATLLLRRTK